MRKFDVRELIILVRLEIVDHHCQRSDNCLVHTFQPTIAIWIIGAGGIFPESKR